MRDGSPSATARRVAAYRLHFERLAGAGGDPAADEALARDVAGTVEVDPDGPMGLYLKGRTAFFDRAVVNALERGVAQFVLVGAGYDGRSVRYARPGVTWWEVDHPDTQADKRSRLARISTHSGHIRFVPHDLRDADLAAALLHSGFQPDGPALFCCEGVAVYLDEEVLEATLDQLRSLCTTGTRLAISLSAPAGDPERRRRFEAAVAAMGEPVRNFLGPDQAAVLLERTRWRSLPISERAAGAGFVMAAPVAQVWDRAASTDWGTGETVQDRL